MRKLLLEISQLMMVATGVHTAQVVRSRVCICLKSSIRFFADSLKTGKRNVQNDSKVNCLSNLKNKGYELGWKRPGGRGKAVPREDGLALDMLHT